MAGKKKFFVIDDEFKDTDALMLPPRGCVPRDWKLAPPGYGGGVAGVNFPTPPKSIWSDLIKEQDETESSLDHIRDRGDNGKPIPSLQQGQYGYCWAHSMVGAFTAVRARDHQPYVPLSAFAVAATIKGGRNQGGWGADALAFAYARGIPEQKFWPQGNAHLSNGTKACWENAARYKPTEGWVDLDAPVYNRKLTFDQCAGLLLGNKAGILDFNWWGHSVCGLRLVEVERGSFGILIWNSWGDGWGDNGTAVLRGSKAVPDAATFIQTVTAAMAA